MKTVTVRFKKLSESAVAPKYAKLGDNGADLTATSVTETDMYIEYGTGLAIELPQGFVGIIYPRSSLSNYDLVLANHVGVVDSNYRGEIKFRFKKVPNFSNGFLANKVFTADVYKVGDRIGQLIVQEVPLMLFEEAEELEESNRGHLAYGSSGK